MANIYQCTKFDENIFIYDRDMAKNRKFKMAAAAMVIFKKCNLVPSDPYGEYLGKPHLVQIGPEIAEIQMFMYFPDGAVRHLRFVYPILDCPRRSP